MRRTAALVVAGAARAPGLPPLAQTPFPPTPPTPGPVAALTRPTPGVRQPAHGPHLM